MDSRILLEGTLLELDSVRSDLLEFYSLREEPSANPADSTRTSAEFMREVSSGSTTCALLGHHKTGKSSLLQATTAQWARAQADDSNSHYLYFDLMQSIDKPMPVQSSESAALCHLFSISKLYKGFSTATAAEIISLMLADQGKNCVIMLDHLDDLAIETLPDVVKGMISKEVLPQAKIVVAGHLSIFPSLSNIAKGSLKCFILDGIRPGHETEVLESLKQYHKGSDRTIDHIQKTFPELCTYPYLVGGLLTKYGENPPETSTKLLETMIVDILNSHLEKRASPQSIQSLSMLSDDLLEEFRLISHLAYLSIVSDTHQYSLDDLTKHVILQKGGNFNSIENHGLGLIVLATPAMSSQETATYKFVHGIVKEFLCAYFLATQPTLDQLRLVYSNIDTTFLYGRHSNVGMLYFGMGPVVRGKLSSAKLKSEPTWTLKPLLETAIGGGLKVDEEPRIKREKILYIYKLLLEAQDTNLVEKFLSKREKYLTLSLEPMHELSESLIHNLSYVISHSGIRKWTISASEATYHTADYIAMLVKKESSRRVEVQTAESENVNFVVQPFFKSGKQLNFYPVVSMYVRCIREILHRVLQMYSPIKLKSSGTDSSYVSFLACECLKEKFESNQVLTIEPIHAVHWIPVKMKDGKTKHASSEDTELHRHMTRHNMEHLEMVLMMSPLPNRICFKNPADDRKIEIIELSQSVSPELLGGQIEEALKSHINDSENIVTNIAQETNLNPSSLNTAELVTLPYIIPATFKGLLGMVPNSDQSVHEAVMARQDIKPEASASKVANKIHDEDAQAALDPRPEIYTSVESKTFYRNQQELSPLKRATARQHQPQMAEEYPVSMESYAQRESSNNSNSTYAYQQSHRPYLSFNQPQSLSSQPSTQTNARQSSLPPSLNIQRQVAVPAGTILHSVDRDMFPPDTIQRLPDEGSLIRKGGNGTVFTAVYGRMEFAVKKTAFRNREFQIHKKLKHPNIIQLSCFMFGPPQPQLKRRYYCFHFMPKVTGDLARMVTDKAELTMMSLSKKYENNPLKLGSIQGNWKFILKELLKGLNYMHSLNIIHRDMKSSNILIKMNCSCDNPLVCTCSTKCGVKISDFDSALELDANGLLQSTPYAAAQVSSQQKLERIYQITPVGTDGYRSPESSQFILTNNLETLKPSLTVKSDIWSTGLIMMRMLNGSNGPTTQQKLATLLLYYEDETKILHSGPKTPKFARVSKKEVDKIMGLNKFRETLSLSNNTWLKKAVECIARCVEVDPHKRPSASDLIKDPFLF